jgi:decaprenylphospho-beta-D-ribofuranose 2-oxidase
MTDLPMENEAQTSIRSFDGTERVQASLSRPDRYRQLFAALSSPAVISRGAGLTYCLASASNQGASVSSMQFNRLLAFDEHCKTVRLEPGVTMGSLLEFAVSRNLLPPVLPGHPNVTVGGGVAMNIHGKNQVHAGNLGDHIRSLTVYHPDRGEIQCSPEVNSDVFQLTIGGFGLTGHITSVELALKRSNGNQILVRRYPVNNLFEGVELMEKLSPAAEYLYSWHNLNLRGKDFGRGIVYSESHCETRRREYATPAGTFRAPLPVAVHNRMTIPLMCKIYQAKENSLRGRKC